MVELIQFNTMYNLLYCISLYWGVSIISTILGSVSHNTVQKPQNMHPPKGSHTLNSITFMWVGRWGGGAKISKIIQLNPRWPNSTAQQPRVNSSQEGDSKQRAVSAEECHKCCLGRWVHILLSVAERHSGRQQTQLTIISTWLSHLNFLAQHRFLLLCYGVGPGLFLWKPKHKQRGCVWEEKQFLNYMFAEVSTHSLCTAPLTKGKISY